MSDIQERTRSAEGAITVNGEAAPPVESGKLPDLLAALDIDPATVRGVAVAVNDEVVPRRAWDDVLLQAGDRVEVVTAKQGG